MIPRRFRWCYQYQAQPRAMPRHLHLRAYHVPRHEHRRYVRARRRGQSLIAWLDTAARSRAPRLLVCPW